MNSFYPPLENLIKKHISKIISGDIKVYVLKINQKTSKYVEILNFNYNTVKNKTANRIRIIKESLFTTL